MNRVRYKAIRVVPGLRLGTFGRVWRPKVPRYVVVLVSVEQLEGLHARRTSWPSAVAPRLS
jgi:hypothetical protein